MMAGFGERAREALKDRDLQEALGRVTSRFRELRKRAFSGVAAPDVLRARARESRERTFRELDRHLERLVANVERAGGKVHFARTGEEACRVVVELARSRGVRTVVKSKSMASEEVELNRALEAAGVRAHETDLGEWIIQLAGERPSHLIAPAVHKTRAQVAELFRKHSGAALGEDVEGLTALARRTLRGYFLEAEMGVSGVNFAVAETGTLAIVTNEGNGRMVTTLPRIHVALMGVEKVVPTLEDLATLLAVLPRSGTGQKLTSYITLLTGPRRPGEADGPEELHLVILDAGRARHLGGPFEEALHCIRCGACLNVCPVYAKVGGHTYNSVYPGPIGSILTPMLRAEEADFELPTASSLCGACLEACPVMVDIPRMLLEMREVRVSQKRVPFLERLAFRFLAFLFRHPQLYDAAGRLGYVLQLPFLREARLRALPGPLAAWTKGRDLPPLARKPFRARWRERERKGGGAPPALPLPAVPPEGDFSREVAETLRLREGHPPHAPVDRPAEGAAAAPSWESVEARLGSFIRELEAVGGKVHRARDLGGALPAVLKALEGCPEGPIALWGRDHLEGLDLGAALRGRGFEVIEGDADRESLARAAAGVTAMEAAVAETGTIVLRSGAGMPRATSLLPPVHIVLLRPGKLLGGLEEMGGWLREHAFGGGSPPSCINLITGPSRTADIELTLILGVHGPGEVHAVVVEEGGGR